MAEIIVKSTASVEVKVVLVLTEEEARALYNITVYGTKTFLGWFYRNLGKAYLQQHEKGFISLFDTIGKELPKHFKRADEARSVFNKLQ